MTIQNAQTPLDKPIKSIPDTTIITLQSKAKILPIVIACSPTTLTKHVKWYQILKTNLFYV
jgi:hypothetical protein